MQPYMLWYKIAFGFDHTDNSFQLISSLLIFLTHTHVSALRKCNFMVEKYVVSAVCYCREWSLIWFIYYQRCDFRVHSLLIIVKLCYLVESERKQNKTTYHLAHVVKVKGLPWFWILSICRGLTSMSKFQKCGII